MKEGFELIGIATVAAALIFGVCLLMSAFEDWFKMAKWRYQYKRRFNKPPTAKCYCKDCRFHNDHTKQCGKFDGWNTAEDWFCWDATPYKHKEGD